MKLPTLKCPFCGAIITSKYIAGQPLTCESCHRQLMISRWHLNLAFWGGTVLTILLSFLLGVRGLRLFIAVIVLWFPVSLLCTFLLNRMIPPPLEAYVPKNPKGHKRPKDSDSQSSSLDLFHK
jgi:hypothetical protein